MRMVTERFPLPDRLAPDDGVRPHIQAVAVHPVRRAHRLFGDPPQLRSIIKGWQPLADTLDDLRMKLVEACLAGCDQL